MAIDLIQNLSGPTVDLLIENNFDIGVLRPWKGKDGRSYVCRMIDGKPKVMVTNAAATLPYDSYKLFDNVVMKTLTSRLRLIADLRQAGLVYNLPNGMAHTVLQYQTQSDISRATISMDPSRRSEGDRPTSDIGNLPLPIVHKDFDFSAREILASRMSNMPLDTSTIELATEKVAEELERLAVGNAGTFTHAGGTIYGLTNFPNRATKYDMTAPTGTNGGTTVSEILTLRQALIDDKHYGPYRLYVNSQWPAYLDADYSTSKGQNTLRERILSIQGIQDIQVLDFLPSTRFEMALVEMNAQTIRIVVGFDAQVVQWESAGGMMKHFKVMAMLIPQLRADTASNSGIGHARTAA